MSNSLQHHGLYSPWNSPGQNAEVGGLSLLEGIFPTQGSNPGFLHCRQILYQLSYQGSVVRGNLLHASLLVSGSVQFIHSVVSDSFRPMKCSTPGLPVHHQLPESSQTHVHRVDDAIQPFHPLSSPSPPALNLSQCQSLFK